MSKRAIIIVVLLFLPLVLFFYIHLRTKSISGERTEGKIKREEDAKQVEPLAEKVEGKRPWNFFFEDKYALKLTKQYEEYLLDVITSEGRNTSTANLRNALKVLSRHKLTILDSRTSESFILGLINIGKKDDFGKYRSGIRFYTAKTLRRYQDKRVIEFYKWLIYKTNEEFVWSVPWYISFQEFPDSIKALLEISTNPLFIGSSDQSVRHLLKMSEYSIVRLYHKRPDLFNNLESLNLTDEQKKKLEVLIKY